MNHVHVDRAKNTNSVMANSPKHIAVAVGVITQNDLFFVCRRQAHQHQGNKWEFPGGKLEANEPAPNALKRELHEEIGIVVITHRHLLDIVFDYPDKKVSLHVFMVDDFTGEAFGAEGQDSQWVTFEELRSLEFPDANQAIIEKLVHNRRLRFE